MSNYLDPDKDQAFSGPSFLMPSHLEDESEIMHAGGVVLHRCGILLRGPSGSGKSLLQRRLRQEANARGLYAALISDDYVRLARPAMALNDDGNGEKKEAEPSALIAFAPAATRRLQEVRGLGVLELEPEHIVSRAVIHLLVDLVAPEEIERMPREEASTISCLGQEITHLAVPERSMEVACDLIFALLSTWKH